jgi:hypothetical protein
VNVADRIRLGFDRFNRRDWEAIARGLPEHFEAVDHLDEQSARGPHAFREITTANGDLAFADLQMEPTEIVPLSAQGERVIVVVRILATASGGTSGVPVDSSSPRSGPSSRECLSASSSSAPGTKRLRPPAASERVGRSRGKRPKEDPCPTAQG